MRQKEGETTTEFKCLGNKIIVKRPRLNWVPGGNGLEK